MTVVSKQTLSMYKEEKVVRWLKHKRHRLDLKLPKSNTNNFKQIRDLWIGCRAQCGDCNDILAIPKPTKHILKQ